MKILTHLTLFFLLALHASFAYSHAGRTNAEGCHTEKATGQYHCHTKNAPTPPAIKPPAPAQITPQPITAQPASNTTTGKILELPYEGFTVWVDCEKRGAIKFRYNAQRDTGNAKRLDSFYLDPNVPSECQQTSAKAYGKSYDRGHLVPANHLDNSESAIKATNTMTNILPQAMQMNRGAWYQTEMITECYRDIDELLIIGGVIWGSNPSDDYFIQSHGIKTPDAYWKVIIRGKGQDERAIAWIVPNTKNATRKKLDSYLVSIDEIEKITGEKIPVANYAKFEKPSTSWIIPHGCNKS